MNLDFLLKYVFASFLLIMLVSVAFFYDKDRQEQNFENDILAITREIATLNLQVNQSALKLRFGLSDGRELNQQLNELINQYYNLSGKISTERKLYDDEMHSHLADLYSQLYKKRQNIENFKRESLLLNQNLAQFQSVADEMIRQKSLGFSLKYKIHQLQTQVSQNLVEPVNPQLTTLVAELSRISSNNNPALSQLPTLTAETSQILQTQQKSQRLLNKILSFNAPTPSENIEQQILRYYADKQDQKSSAQNKLFIIAMLSIMYVMYLLVSLRKESIALAKILADTEKQQIALNEHAIVSAADVRGNITYVNAKFCEISGYSKEELLGQNHRIVKSDHSKEVYEEMWRTICQGKVWHGEIKNKKKDGGCYWVSGTIVPFLNSKGKPTQYISIRTDITRQKELEKQLLDGQHFLKQVTGAMAQGLYALDKDGLCTFWNKEAEHILGWTEQELLNQDLHGIIHFQDEYGNPVPKKVCLSHQAVLNNQIYSSDTEFFTHKDGHILPISIIAVPLLEHDKTIGTVAVFSDITKRKADEKIVHQAIISAQQASQAKSDFLANMSHEIRTPMNGIIGMTELTLETHLTVEQREYIEIVKDSSYALLEIVNDILDFSKIESGKLVLEHIEFDVSELLKKTLAVLAPKSEQKGVMLTIENNLAETTIPRIIGDPGRLRQVILNLVGNAIKFTPYGSIKVSLDLIDKNQDKCCLLFTISDTGIGIPENKQSAIFDAFSQADTSVTRRFGGTGLGLSISKQFIELMAGEIWLESTLNIGTTFFFTCWFDYKEDNLQSLRQPISPSDNSPDLQTLAVNTNTTAIAHDTKTKLQILLAEDNLINQKLARKLLEKQGYEVTIANNGLEAVNWFEQQKFDLILMDFQMPEMNGLEAASRIRAIEQQQGGHIPIIAMTANAMKEDKDRAIAAGMDAYVPKPINLQELLTEIGRFFAAKSNGSSEESKQNNTAICNWDVALTRLGGETEILEMLVNLFLEEQTSYMDNIKHALAGGNPSTLERELHTLRGVCATIGAEKIEKEVKKLESLSIHDTAGYKHALAEIEQHLAELTVFLRRKMNLA